MPEKYIRVNFFSGCIQIVKTHNRETLDKMNLIKSLRVGV